MNLVDFHVTKILSEPIKVEREWGTYWKIEVEYWDDGGSGQTTWLTCSETAEEIYVGYIGQH